MLFSDLLKLVLPKFFTSKQITSDAQGELPLHVFRIPTNNR